MSRMTRRTTAAFAACLTGALALPPAVAAAASRKDPAPAPRQSAAAGPVTIKFMITSNGPADVKLQQDTVKPWEDKTGNKVEVIAASDRNQQLTPGLRGRLAARPLLHRGHVLPDLCQGGQHGRLR